MDVVASKAFVLCSYCRIDMKQKQLKENTEKKHGKNPAYRKQRISRPMGIVAPIFVFPLPLWKGLLAFEKSYLEEAVGCLIKVIHCPCSIKVQCCKF